jgi:hypothetical protein
MYGQAAGGAHDSAGARLADDLAVTGRISAETDPSLAARRECDVLLIVAQPVADLVPKRLAVAP